MRIVALRRYPVKGLNGQSLATARTRVGEALAGDRAYAFVRDPQEAGAAMETGPWRPKTAFAQVARFPALATAAVAWRGEDVPDADDLKAAQGVVAQALGFVPRLARAQEGAFGDVPQGWISLLNLASVDDLARDVAGLTADIFRANVHIEGAPPWAEEQWTGKTLTFASGARARVMEPTGRCPAVDADPTTGRADVPTRAALARRRGRARMGVYIEIIREGGLAVGDALTLD